MLEHLHSTHEALASIFSTEKEKNLFADESGPSSGGGTCLIPPPLIWASSVECQASLHRNYLSTQGWGLCLAPSIQLQLGYQFLRGLPGWGDPANTAPLQERPRRLSYLLKMGSWRSRGGKISPRKRVVLLHWEPAPRPWAHLEEKVTGLLPLSDCLGLTAPLLSQLYLRAM